MGTKQLVEDIKRLLMSKEKGFLPFDIAAVLLFGSWARGTESKDSDIDLLVVAEGINSKRHRRGSEIAEIKHFLPGASLDILLLTKGETLSNFRNHNPLFLDIAEEGIIILDRDGFLLGLIAETKDYIRQKGIDRFGDGWIFPVKRGIPTYLSKISNKDFSYAMLKDGERDFKIGERLISDVFYDKAVYHFQQSVEKSIKSILIAMGIFQKTHFIGEVLRKIVLEKGVSEKWRADLLEIAEISEAIEPEVSLSRYPGIIDDSLWLPFDEYKEEDAEVAMKKAEKVVSVAKEFLKEWFSS